MLTSPGFLRKRMNAFIHTRLGCFIPTGLRPHKAPAVDEEDSESESEADLHNGNAHGVSRCVVPSRGLVIHLSSEQAVKLLRPD